MEESKRALRSLLVLSACQTSPGVSTLRILALVLTAVDGDGDCEGCRVNSVPRAGIYCLL